MRASLKALGIALALALGAQSAQAGWYTARGSAPIIDDDVASARRNAIDDALRNASLQAGANVSIEQVVENGTLLNERLQISSRSPIRRMVVIEEQENGKAVTVLVKALIDDNAASDCYAGSIKKAVLPVMFRFRDSDASASASDIYDFEDYLSNLLYDSIGQSPALNMLPATHERLIVDKQVANAPYADIRHTLYSISRRTHAQFIVVGQIDSLAKSEVGNNSFTRMMYNPTRTIRFGVKVYDLYSGEEVFSKNYAGDAEWTFNRGETINLRSDRFATSDYGQRVNQLVKYAVADVVTKLRCTIPSARIINVGISTISINLGSNANLKEGMQFTIHRRNDIEDRHGNIYYQNDSTGVLYKIVSISPSMAVLAPSDEKAPLVNVMLDDVVTLEPEPDEYKPVSK